MIRSIILCTITLLISFRALSQAPVVWIFGKNAGLDFNTTGPTAVSYPIDNCYSPSSVQCGTDGNLLFYCDGRDIKDRDGNIMTGSSNPVWPAPVHIVRKIVSNIVPVTNDSNRYFVFTLTPSSGEPPFGTYYNGALTYSIVDMRLNGGKGGIDTDFSNMLLNTELDMDFIVVPAKNCGFWLIAYRRSDISEQFITYLITGNGVAGPVYSAATVPGFPYPFYNLKLSYAYRHGKIVATVGSSILACFDFNTETGAVSNGNKLMELDEFRSRGGGSSPPSFCLSPDEQYIYLLGYPQVSTGIETPYIRLQQIPVDLASAIPAITGAANIIFMSDDSRYLTPSTSVPYYSSDCAIRPGPDNKVYLLYNTAMSFLGRVNKPDMAGSACDFSPEAITLLPNTFGSYYFPAVENKRKETEIYYKAHDTLLCFSEPFNIGAGLAGPSYMHVWNDGSTGLYLEIRKEGIYWVHSMGNCNEPQQVDTFTVRFEPPEKCHCTILIPTAFTPNNDMKNDLFRPIIPVTCLDGNYELIIFNRWGNTLFRSYDILKGWDGIYNGLPADVGVYYYQVRYKDIQHQEHNYKGDITLLR